MYFVPLGPAVILYVKSPPIKRFLIFLSYILNKRSNAGNIKYEPEAPTCAKPPTPPNPTPPKPPNPPINGSTIESVNSAQVNQRSSFISLPAGT